MLSIYYMYDNVQCRLKMQSLCDRSSNKGAEQRHKRKPYSYTHAFEWLDQSWRPSGNQSAISFSADSTASDP